MKTQLEFDFSDFEKITIIDQDGDTYKVNRYGKKIKSIMFFLKCTKKKAKEVLEQLEKEYDVYSDYLDEIFLCRENQILYHFEIGGETYYKGHKYKSVNAWDFKKLIEGKKIKSEIKHRPQKELIFTLTEKQMQRSQQLWYAHSIGFNITYKDYQRFYIEI